MNRSDTYKLFATIQYFGGLVLGCIDAGLDTETQFIHFLQDFLRSESLQDVYISQEKNIHCMGY